jgi:tetratricopeptide (TPR) repeat protein
MYRPYFFVLLFFIISHSLFSQSDSVLLTNGAAVQKSGNNAQAILELSSIIKKHEPAVDLFIKKCDEYQKFNEFERVERGLEMPAIDVSYARPYYLRGLAYAAMKNTGKAIEDFTTAVLINPELGSAYYERGKIRWSDGKKYESCCDFSRARSLGDSLAREMFDEKFCWNEALAYYKDALTNLRLNHYDIALGLIQKSILLSLDSAINYLIRGECYSGMGKYEMAFLDFDRAIKGLPNNAEAYFVRGAAFYTKKKYQEAFNDFDNAVRLNNRNADAYLYRAYACEGINKVQSALYDYAQVQRLKPNDPIAFYKSGLLKNDNGDSKGACIDFKKAANLGSTEAADYAKGCK